MIDLQPFTISIIIYVFIFIGVLLAYEGLQQLIFRQETRSEARNRRMKMIQNGASTEQVLQLLRDPALLNTENKKSFVHRFRRLLMQSGLSIGPIWLVVAGLVVAALTYVVLSTYLSSELAAIAGGSAGLILPFMVLIGLKDARLKKLSKQLPDALDLMARGLKVGHPIAVTIGNVATDMPDPIGTEFGLIQDQINYGDDVSTAFHDFANRVATEDVKYLAVSVGIQHGTGGNLARILNVLSQVIRDRFKMRKKIKAISAEGRLSGLILTFLPVFIYLSIELTTPSFYGDVRSDPLYPYFAYVIIGLTILQGVILHRLVKFRI